MVRSGITRFAALASIVALAATACSSSATAAPSTGSGGGGQIISVGGVNHVVVRWFVGLGSGTNPSQITAEQKVVADFNAAQDKTPTGTKGMPIMLSLEIVQNTTATDILKTELTANNAPDIIGPVGIKGRAAFPGTFADITPLAKAAGFDLTQYDPGVIKQLSTNGVLDGFPYAAYPSMIFYNKDLFDEA
jgi:multiple sugar transport system substrate-binding protein